MKLLFKKSLKTSASLLSVIIGKNQTQNAYWLNNEFLQFDFQWYTGYSQDDTLNKRLSEFNKFANN